MLQVDRNEIAFARVTESRPCKVGKYLRSIKSTSERNLITKSSERWENLVKRLSSQQSRTCQTRCIILPDCLFERVQYVSVVGHHKAHPEPIKPPILYRDVRYAYE